MARANAFSGLSEFLTVADLGSFRAAAAQLGVTPAAISQAVKALETRVGMTLLLRTTRSVALSEAGSHLLARLRPAAADIHDVVEELSTLRGQPKGLLRVSAPRIALDLVLYPLLPAFRRACPDVSLDIDVNDEVVELTSRGFDAGIRIGQMIERDMVAVRLTPDFRWCVLGSDDYLAARGRPKTPQDLTRHECIRYRFPTAKSVYRWEFTQNNRAISVDAPGSITVNDHLSMIALAKRGAGLAYTADLVAARELADGSLKPVLAGFCPTTPGLFLYFPAKSERQPKLRAFIDFATQALRKKGARSG